VLAWFCGRVVIGLALERHRPLRPEAVSPRRRDGVRSRVRTAERFALVAAHGDGDGNGTRAARGARGVLVWFGGRVATGLPLERHRPLRPEAVSPRRRDGVRSRVRRAERFALVAAHGDGNGNGTRAAPGARGVLARIRGRVGIGLTLERHQPRWPEAVSPRRRDGVRSRVRTAERSALVAAHGDGNGNGTRAAPGARGVLARIRGRVGIGLTLGRHQGGPRGSWGSRLVRWSGGDWIAARTAPAVVSPPAPPAPAPRRPRAPRPRARPPTRTPPACCGCCLSRRPRSRRRGPCACLRARSGRPGRRPRAS
jgi:hypothetical protein